MNLAKKDILGTRDMTKGEIEHIISTAQTMKYIITTNNKKTPHLSGKSIVALFYENSTRTRTSFELASKYMGANFASVTASTSSVAKGETLIDTGKNLEAMGTDVIVMRHPMSGAAELLAKNLKISVINAGDGMNEHPSQALLDMYTIKEKKGKIEGLKVAIVGDIYHSRVARSDIWGLKKMGAEVNVAGPSTLIPPEIEKMGVNVFNCVHEAIIDADVVIALRIQLERQKKGLFPTTREYAKFFGLDDDRLKLAKSDVIVLHPGPVNRGVELSSYVVDGKNSVITEQVTNGLAVRMAMLYILTRRSRESENID